MAQIEGIHEAPLTWQRDDMFSFTGEGTTTILRVEIRRLGQAVQWGGGFSQESYGDVSTMELTECGSELVVPVDIYVSTTDGHLDFCEPTGLTITRDGASLALRRTFAAQGGSLEVLAIHDDGMEVNKFVVELGFTRQGRLVGHIRGTYRSSNYGPHRATYACFPDPPPPELRVGDSLRACDR